ncbi:hypothetical protein [Lysinibacillus sp. 54212]
MTYTGYFNSVPIKHPFTHENVLDNDVAYLFEEQFEDEHFDHFDDNDF